MTIGCDFDPRWEQIAWLTHYLVGGGALGIESNPLWRWPSDGPLLKSVRSGAPPFFFSADNPERSRPPTWAHGRHGKAGATYSLQH